jgi:hypothetical protein
MEQTLEDGRKIVGSRVTTKTFCELDENGYWKVDQSITQERLIEGEDEWEVKTVQQSAHAKQLEVAIANAILALERFLVPRNSDLFKEPNYEKGLAIPMDKTEDGEYVN